MFAKGKNANRLRSATQPPPVEKISLETISGLLFPFTFGRMFLSLKKKEG